MTTLLFGLGADVNFERIGLDASVGSFSGFVAGHVRGEDQQLFTHDFAVSRIRSEFPSVKSGQSSPSPIDALRLINAHARAGGGRKEVKVWVSDLEKWVDASVYWLLPQSTIAFFFGEEHKDGNPLQIFRALLNRIKRARRKWGEVESAVIKTALLSLGIYLADQGSTGSLEEASLFQPGSKIQEKESELEMMRREFEESIAESDEAAERQKNAKRERIRKLAAEKRGEENLGLLKPIREFLTRSSRPPENEKRSSLLKATIAQKAKASFDDVDDAINPTRKRRRKLREDLNRKVDSA